MAGLVEKIQLSAASNSTSVSELLRQVKLAAAKLKLQETMEWVDLELNGYTGGHVPEYRKVCGQIKGLNPYQGWIPIVLGHGLDEVISDVSVREPITSLEKLMNSDATFFTVPLPPELIMKINRVCNIQLGTMAHHISPGVVVNIVERVKTLVLDWAINLENLGITGEGVSFTAEEKDKASNAGIHINTFNGNLHQGNVSGTNARANLASSDHSNNTVSSSNVLVDLENEVRRSLAGPLKDELLSLISEMKTVQKTEHFIPLYQRFVTTAANHMTVIAPFLPALTGLLPS
ncbi:hypothetical protein SAMN05444678_1264 [Sphingomonas sp. YR710]|uniref:AbiTii domain-containing protein n=1 Tax=Sphingomonas sp. YR710 TaxID=1882773 RepID=UPI000881C12D|nr:hypothetical protein [Sphingomonas sp. YR710]SDD84657.1 hypothetical protein SAMN05444678_1264 [Sphingomonas sp. YR710]